VHIIAKLQLHDDRKTLMKNLYYCLPHCSSNNCLAKITWDSGQPSSANRERNRLREPLGPSINRIYSYQIVDWLFHHMKRVNTEKWVLCVVPITSDVQTTAINWTTFKVLLKNKNAVAFLLMHNNHFCQLITDSFCQFKIIIDLFNFVL